MILDRILAVKAETVAAARARVPLAAVARAAAAAPPPRGFAAALAAGAEPAAGARPAAVIAEVKRASPSRGLIRPDFDPVAIATAYTRAGAAALSVLTDEPFFQGCLADLRAVRAAVPLPVLRKDFIIDPYQVYEARAAGADAVLLITAAFMPPAAGAGAGAGAAAVAAGAAAAAARPRTPDDLAALLHLTADLGMDALVEVHTAAELALAADLGARLIGINNRDLRTFATRLQVTLDLAPAVPPAALLVSESGIATAEDVAILAAAGARAVLVGEALLRQSDPGAGVRALLGVG